MSQHTNSSDSINNVLRSARMKADSMKNKLSWDEIKKHYPDQWVELTDCEWDDFEPDPRSGVVRNSAKVRKEIHAKFMSDPVDSSAIVYTGKMRTPEGLVFSANLHQYGVRK
jgi:hypothetical protein